MTWTAPNVTSTSPPLLGDERACLQGWLDLHRATLQWKCSGLDADQLRLRPLSPSGMSLLGIVRHLVEVERWWFRINAAQQSGLDYEYCTDEDQEADWNDLDTADAAADLETYRQEVAACNAAMMGISLDDVVPDPDEREDKNVRWIFVHMIEEYARHNGHADLIREAVDGTTGDFPRS